MTLLALSRRYFGKAKWDPNVRNALSPISWWGRVRGGVVGLQGRGGESLAPRRGWFQVPLLEEGLSGEREWGRSPLAL